MAITRRSRSVRCGTGSIISRRAIGWWGASRALACASTSQPSPSVSVGCVPPCFRVRAANRARSPPGSFPPPARWAMPRGAGRAGVLAGFEEAARDPIPWRETASAPPHEVVHRHVDLERLLPLPTHNEHDGGPYVTAGLMITRNPRTGKQNVSIHRCQLHG